METRAMTRHPLHILINPSAAKGRAGNKAQEAITALRVKHPESVCIETKNAEDAVQYIQSLDTPSFIVAAGGDGTLHHIAGAMVHSPHTLGILPAGTGNDFASAIGLKSIERAAEAISSGDAILIDTCTVEWEDETGRHIRPFINAVGMGFDAAVAQRMLLRPGGSGIVPYLISVLREVCTYRLHPGEITMPGSSLSRNVFLVTTGNGISSGGGFRLTPHARVNDGLLDCCIVSNATRLRVLRVLPQAISGKHLRHPEVEYVQTTSLECRTTSPLPVHADGEVLTGNATHIVVTIVPQSLKLFIDTSVYPQ